MNSATESVCWQDEWWTTNRGGWATWIVLCLMLGLYSIRIAARAMKKRHLNISGKDLPINPISGITHVKYIHEPCESFPTVTEVELQQLLLLLDDAGDANNAPWISVVDKQSKTLSYHAKLRDPEDGGPTEYLSISIFDNCSTEKLRDFYMDSEYRMLWDGTFESHEQLDVNKETGVEIGRFVRKFPFMHPREYVLAWKVWEGEDNTFYYFAKQCRHPLAPENVKYTRVEHYLSGWQISKVPGRDACQVRMWHQEDSSLMAKMGFSHRIWNFMCDMEKSLRKYKGRHFTGDIDAVTLAQKVPAGLVESSKSVAHPHGIQPSLRCKSNSGRKKRRIRVRETGKWLASGMLVLGGAMFCKSGSVPLGAKIAAAYAIKRLIKPHMSMRQV